jgi:hypothetical protein
MKKLKYIYVLFVFIVPAIFLMLNNHFFEAGIMLSGVTLIYLIEKNKEIADILF